MGQRIVIDPLTRIEGHLKIEVEIENGIVKNAWSSSTMARGWEVLLKEKDPRDAPYVCSRVCSVCEGVHAIASVHALEDAFGTAVPEAGRIMRNLFCGGLYMHDHYIHFYVLSALDYLDIMAVAGYKGNDPGLQGIKDKIAGLARNNDTAPFTPRYKPDDLCVTDPETVTTLVSHYITAVQLKAKSHKMLALIMGIQPTTNTIMVGGCTATPSVSQLIELKSLWEEQLRFVNDVYIPDVLALAAGPLKPLAASGIGAAQQNYLCYPMFPQADPKSKNDYPFGGGSHLMQGGVITGGYAAAAQPVDFRQITESVKYAWYNYPAGIESLHPSAGTTEFNPRKNEAYTFIKAPRYQGLPMEVGPLARGLVNKYPKLLDLIKVSGKPGALARHLARAIESQLVGQAGLAWIDRLIDIAGKGTLSGMAEATVPHSARGMGCWDAPRGALAHWVDIDFGRIKNYQLVVPSTWNASPRDDKGTRGPYEESLIGVPVPDADNPINVVRVIRSFDPCLACAVHLIDPETNDVRIYRIT
jgi:Ni,Fe-hydrogenase I large subunit